MYAIDSWVSLLWPEQALYFNVIRDMYEAYVLYEFFKFLTDAAGGEEVLAEKLEDLPQIRYTLPFCCFHIKPGRTFLFRCKQMILQYVYVKVALAAMTFVLQLLGWYDEGNFAPDRGYLYITIVYNVSIGLSLYFLVLFEESASYILEGYHPIVKFLAIKAVIFFEFWQSLGISILVSMHFLITERPGYTSGDISNIVNNALITVELFPIAVAFAMAFAWDDYKDPERPLSPAAPTMLVSVIKNFGKVTNVKDIVEDTKDSFKKELERNIDIDDFCTVSIEERRSRIILEADIKKCGDDLAKIWRTRHVALVSKPLGIIYWKKNPWIMPADKIPQVRGFIAFKDIELVTSKHATQFNVLFARNRVWRFRGASSAERDFWVSHIKEFVSHNNDGSDPASDLRLVEETSEEDQVELVDIEQGPRIVYTNYDDSDSDSEENPHDPIALSDQLDHVEHQAVEGTSPRRFSGPLSFLNRGIDRLSRAVTPMAAPPAQSASIDTSNDGLTGSNDSLGRNPSKEDTDDTIAVNF